MPRRAQEPPACTRCFEGEVEGAELQALRDELDVAERHLEAMQRRPAAVYTQVRRELEAALDVAERRLQSAEESAR
jgi:hypothetical protein